MVDSIINYLEATFNAFWISSMLLLLPGIIIFSSYKYYIFREKSGKTIALSIAIMIISMIISFGTLILFFYNSEGLFDFLIYVLFLLPYSIISCSFLIVPIVFLLLYIVRRIEKRDATVLKKPFLIIEGIAMFLGLITAIVMIYND